MMVFYVDVTIKNRKPSIVRLYDVVIIYLHVVCNRLDWL